MILVSSYSFRLPNTLALVINVRPFSKGLHCISKNSIAQSLGLKSWKLDFYRQISTSNARIWFYLYDYGTGKPYKDTCATSVLRYSLPVLVIDQFCKAVKLKCSNKLSSIDAGDLLVFQNKQSFDNRDGVEKEEPLKYSCKLSGLGETEEDALIVAVPSSDALNFTGSSPQTDKSLITATDPEETLQKVIEAAEGESNEAKKIQMSISQNLLSSSGADFSFSDRESSFEILASSLEQRFYCHKVKLTDKQFRQLPFLADGPGSGKSRFLQELPKSFAAYVKNLKQPFYRRRTKFDKSPELVESYLKNTPAAFDDFKNTLCSALFINISFGNSSIYTSKELELGIEGSICLRILYPYFTQRYSTFCSFFDAYVNKDISLPKLTLWRTLMIISKENQCIVLGIDELNVLHHISQDLFKQLFSLVGSVTHSYPPFFVPVLAGTVIGPIVEAVFYSQYPPLHIPLPLLSFDSCVHILGTKNKNFAEQIKTNQSLRQVVLEIGGHCRALEILYVNLPNHSIDSPDFHHEIINDVANTLLERYPMSKSPVFGKAIAYYFLSMRVVEYMKVSEIESPLTFLDLKEAGVLKLDRLSDNSIGVKIPFIFVICYLRSSLNNEYSKFWARLLISNKMHRQCWEEFNCSYMAFRLSLFAKLGITTTPLSDFLSGAKMNISEDIRVKIPSIHDIKIAKNSYKFPSTRQTESDIGTCVLNAPGAAFDGYVYLETTAGKRLLVQQMKLASKDSVTPQKLSNSKIAEEYDNAFASIDQFIPKTDYIILILGRCKGVYDAEKLPTNCAVVSLGEFEEFYGEEYSQYLKIYS